MEGKRLRGEKQYRVFFQWGTIDEGVKEFGVFSAKNEKEAIEKAIINENEEDKNFYRQHAKAVEK